jgi:hypothetical protein
MAESLHDILFNSHRTEILEFEQIGETELRYKIANRTFFGNRQLADEWLRQQDQSRRDNREEETLSIANRAADAASEANFIAAESLSIAQASAKSASEQARWARWAVIIAVIAAMIATKDEILKFILWISP